MKTKLLTLVLMLVIFNCSIIKGQNIDDNFNINDSEIIWQKVYPTNLSFENLIAFFKESGIFQSIEIKKNKIIGDLKIFDCYNKDIVASFGILSNMGYYIKLKNYTGFFIIEFKDGKYRVTVKHIQMISYSSGTEYPPVCNIERIALNNTQFTNNFLFTIGKALNYSFLKMFEVREIREENW